MPVDRRLAAAFVLSGTLCVADCGSTTPAGTTAPTAVDPTVTGIQIGVAGNAPAILSPGQVLRMFALAAHSTGDPTDATNASTWQSSNPAVARVDSGGMVVGVSEGAVTISARYQSVTADMHVDVLRPGCDATLTPQSLTFTANIPDACSDDAGNCVERPIKLDTSAADCRWTAKTDAPWLSFSSMSQMSTFTPLMPGSGTFWVAPRPNRSTSARIGYVLISFPTGAPLVFTVNQERPPCAIAVNPTAASFPGNGGAGFFDVTADPPTCSWQTSPSTSVTIISGASGTGSGRVQYQAAPNRFSLATTYSIQVTDVGKSSPPATHSIQVASK
jgi:hypothetical protein